MDGVNFLSFLNRLWRDDEEGERILALEITISAVGDILMKQKLIDSAKIPGKNRYQFDSMFKHVAPLLRAADLSIGNLETTFSGRTNPYERRNPKTGFPLFNCPDELAKTLKKTGFNVLTTANNHCLDGGIWGLKRTLRILDKNALQHTGTFRFEADSKRFLIQNVKGIRIGILAYTKGTNSIPFPEQQRWLVNLIDTQKMRTDLKRLKPQVDLLIVCLHFGREYRQIPDPGQVNLVKWLFRHGADVVLGSHPHVLQPMLLTPQRKFAIFSLGNFISSRLRKNPFTLNGVIIQLQVKKENSGKTTISGVRYIPTWVYEQNHTFTVVPIPHTLGSRDLKIPSTEREQMKRMWRHTRRILHRKIAW